VSNKISRSEIFIPLCSQHIPSYSGLQNDSEPGLVLEHPLVGGRDLLERVCLYLGRDVSQRTELQGILRATSVT